MTERIHFGESGCRILSPNFVIVYLRLNAAINELTYKFIATSFDLLPSFF